MTRGSRVPRTDAASPAGAADPADAGGGPAGAGRGGGRGGGGGGRGGMTPSGVTDGSEGTSALDPQYMRQVSAMLQEVLDEPGRMTIEVSDKDVAFTGADGHVQRFRTDNAKEKHQ